jgi:hypothetical protein
VREKDTRAGGVSSSHKTPMPSLTDFCIYAQFDPPFAKLPNLRKPIAKPLESNFWAFFSKKQEYLTQLQNRWSCSNTISVLVIDMRNWIRLFFVYLTSWITV